MVMLGFETISNTASVGLYKDNALFLEHTYSGLKTHSEALFPAVDTLLREANISTSSLNAIAVDIGPGSFTGIRIGVCAANAMANALNIPVVGVNSLEVLYERVKFYTGSVCVMIDAGNENAYIALFRAGKTIQQPIAYNVLEYIKTIDEPLLFIGDAAENYNKDIIYLHKNAIVVTGINNQLGASLLLSAANGKLTKYNNIQNSATPFYLRPSQAERVLEQKKKKEEI